MNRNGNFDKHFTFTRNFPLDLIAGVVLIFPDADIENRILNLQINRTGL